MLAAQIMLPVYIQNHVHTFSVCFSVSDKDMKVDFLLQILLNCQKTFILGIPIVAMAKKQISQSH